MFVRELEPLATFVRKLNNATNLAHNHNQLQPATQAHASEQDPHQLHHCTTSAPNDQTWERLKGPEVGRRAEVERREELRPNREPTRARDKLSSAAFGESTSKRAKRAKTVGPLVKRAANESPSSVSSVDSVHAESGVMLRQWIRICRKSSKHCSAGQRRGLSATS